MTLFIQYRRSLSVIYSHLRVSAVDILRREELLHAPQVPLLGGVEEGRVAPEQIEDVLVALLDEVHGGVAVAVLLGRVRAVA